MRVYKTACTKTIPPGAKIVIRKGVRCARYKVKGQWVEYPLTKKGDAVRIEADCWSLEFRDNKDIHRYMKAYSNKGASDDLKKNIVKLLECGQDGMQDWIKGLPVRVRDKLIEFNLIDTKRSVIGKTIHDLVAEYEDWMRTTIVPRHTFFRSKHYCNTTLSCIRRIIDACGFCVWSDIRKIEVEKYLSGRCMAKRTYNNYLISFKMFCKWVVDNDYATKSPIKNLKFLTISEDADDSENYRRALSPEDFSRLLIATEKAPVRYGMTGHERAVLYLLAVETGLRKNEIRNLLVSSFDLEKGMVKVEAQKAKSRRKVTRYLKKERLPELRDFFRNKVPNARAFSTPRRWRGADMVRADLKETVELDYDGHTLREAVPFKTENGICDLHAMRHTYSTSLSSTNATWVEHKILMGHSLAGDVTTRYTHPEPERLLEIVEQLPRYQWPRIKKAQRATGTDGKMVDAKSLRSDYVSDAHRQTNMGASGIKKCSSDQTTVFKAVREGVGCILPRQPLSTNTTEAGLQNPVNTELIEKGKNNPEAEEEKFTFFLRSADPDLRLIVEGWPKLSVELRKVIVKMVL